MSKKEHDKLRVAIGLLETGNPEDHKNAMRILYRLAGISVRFKSGNQPGVLSLITNIIDSFGGTKEES